MMRPRNVRRPKAPACTHVTMERISLSEANCDACPSCGNYQTLGFLYICRQERDISYLESLAAEVLDANYLDKSAMRQELEHIGMSRSVIAAAEQGLYTYPQLEKLKAGKTKLNRVIAEALEAVQMAADAHAPPNTDGAANSIPQMLEMIPGCQLTCHHCRPYFRDRISMSFDAVFNDEIRPIAPAEAEYLPVKSAQIIRGIESHPMPVPLSIRIDETSPSTVLSPSAFSDDSPSTHSHSSSFTYKTTQSEIDMINTTRRHRRRFYKMGHRSSGEIGRDLSRQLPLFTRHGLKEALKGVFRASERESSSSGSNITLPMPNTAAARDRGDVSSVGEFDLGALRRVKRQKDRFDLRQDHKNGMCASDHEDANGGVLRRQTSSRSMGESERSGSEVSVYSCVSEGSEVEVEGGVALTEEAVETHTPDIISDPVALENIMTQV